MTTHHASASYIGQRYESSSTFSSLGPNFKNFSNPSNPFRFSGSSYQKRPHYKMDYYPEVGLRILNSLTDESKPSAAGVSEPPKKKNIVFGPQVKMNIPPSSNNLFASWGNSSPGNFPVTIPPPLGGSNAVYEVGGGSHLEGSSATKRAQIFHDCALGCHPCKFFDVLVKERQVRQRYHEPNFPNSSTSYSFNPFLRICYTCKRKLKAGEDIYIYRGDSSFCSEECRLEEILAEGMEETVDESPKSSPTPAKNGAIFFLGNTPLAT